MPLKDHRSALIHQLKNYNPLNEKDRKQAGTLLDFVVRNPLCFERTLTEGHITGSAWVVNSVGDKVLLTHHKKLDKWLQLGGHADGSADVLSVALREAQEESGLNSLQPISHDIFDVDIHFIPAYKQEPEHFHYDIRFVLQADIKEPLVLSEESKELKWVDLLELEHYSREESFLRMKEKWILIRSALKPD